MSYPQKTKGFRQITVNEASYRWCFRSGQNACTVTLQGQDSSGQQAIVNLLGVSDSWLAFPEKTHHYVVTPVVIRQLINEALKRGWKPNERLSPIAFDFNPNATE